MTTSPYSRIEVVDGFVEYKMKSWDDFTNYINKHFLKYSNQYIWRGQENSQWLLESALDRLLKKFERKNRKEIREKHLENFKYAIRGRSQILSSSLSNEDYWALGQHYGLATPLLDWTKSPFIAAFFAISDMPNKYSEKYNNYDEELKDKSFAIYALHKKSVEDKNVVLLQDDIVKIVEPLVDSNPRLVSQGGLFTMMPLSIDIESWVKKNFKGNEDLEILIKFTIPYKNMESTKKILSILDRMNINHLSLFPDLHGSCSYCNLKLGVNNY